MPILTEPLKDLWEPQEAWPQREPLSPYANGNPQGGRVGLNGISCII